MTDSRPSSRPPLASVAALLAVVLLFGAATFVAGLVVGGADTVQLEGNVGSSLPPSSASAQPPTGTPGPTPILETVTCAEPSEAFALLCDTYARIKADYVDEVSDEALVEGAVRGLVEYGLADPYSGYLPPEDYEQALDDLSGEFSGIGAEVGLRNLDEPGDEESCSVITNACALVIIAPLSGSPAEAAGLRSGDVVIAVDGVETAGSTVNEQVFKVRGEAGTDVTLTVRRGARELQITITRAVIELREVEAKLLEDGIGYIHLTSFTDRAHELFRNALVGLLEDGATRIVFDLRNNPGGYIVAAEGIASEFVPAGELLFTVESGDDVQRWVSEPGGVAVNVEDVVVLVNGGSASASEIVAAALQETGRARLIGEPTFGKNTVQVWTELENGGGLRITTDRWFTPNHDSVADGGVQPDIVVAGPEDPNAEEDPPLDRALAELGG
jgi:carboxyl-terminal processing protease